MESLVLENRGECHAWPIEIEVEVALLLLLQYAYAVQGAHHCLAPPHLAGGLIASIKIQQQLPG